MVAVLNRVFISEIFHKVQYNQIFLAVFVIADIGPVTEIKIRTVLNRDKEWILHLHAEMKTIKLHSPSAHVQEESRRGCFDVCPVRPRPPSRRAGVIDRVAVQTQCWSGAMSLGEGVTLPGQRRKDCCLHSISGVRLEPVSSVRAERPRRFSAQPSGISETNPEIIRTIATNRPVFQLVLKSTWHVFFLYYLSKE